jgi:hypothetical protein
MEELKLVALDKDDVEVMSAHLQDALVKVGDIFWRPGEHRFVMAVNRFDRMNAVDADALKTKSPEYRRCRTALRFERVVCCKCRGLDRRGKDAVPAGPFVWKSSVWKPSSSILARFSRRWPARTTSPTPKSSKAGRLVRLGAFVNGLPRSASRGNRARQQAGAHRVDDASLRP